MKSGSGATPAKTYTVGDDSLLWCTAQIGFATLSCKNFRVLILHGLFRSIPQDCGSCFHSWPRIVRLTSHCCKTFGSDLRVLEVEPLGVLYYRTHRLPITGSGAYGATSSTEEPRRNASRTTVYFRRQATGSTTACRIALPTLTDLAGDLAAEVSVTTRGSLGVAGRGAFLSHATLSQADSAPVKFRSLARL
jgi:hypothetical protein